eukprot:JP447463.1.p1 GENE.JP447463.1~~JP447463.1.p1  ORF type:complete len:154 (-),score=48.17 JP447463.1:97-558(-)
MGGGGHKAAGTGDLEAIKASSGKDVNERDAGNWTPLMNAAVEGDYEICKVLLEKGADPFLKNNNDANALDYATRRGHKEVADLIQQYMNHSAGSKSLGDWLKGLDAESYAPKFSDAGITQVSQVKGWAKDDFKKIGITAMGVVVRLSKAAENL